MDSILCFLKRILYMMNRGVHGISLFKVDAIGLNIFTEMLLKITSGQKILVMWDI